MWNISTLDDQVQGNEGTGFPVPSLGKASAVFPLNSRLRCPICGKLANPDNHYCKELAELGAESSSIVGPDTNETQYKIEDQSTHGDEVDNLHPSSIPLKDPE